MTVPIIDAVEQQTLSESAAQATKPGLLKTSVAVPICESLRKKE